MKRSAVEAERDRSLWPREHGAYGQLAFPLVVALTLGRPPRLGAALLALAAVCCFLAHEPLLVNIGRRGARARREDGRRAALRAVVLAGAAIGSAGVGFALCPSALPGAGAPAALVVVLGGLIAVGKERSPAGEIVAAATLSCAAVPAALAGAVPARTAIEAAAVWTAGFASATLAVRSFVGAARARPGPRRAAVAFALAVLGTAVALAAANAVSVSAPLCLAPIALAAAVLGARPPDPRRLHAVGWSLVGASALSCAAMIATMP